MIVPVGRKRQGSQVLSVRWMSGIGVGALVALGLAMAPAVGASEDLAQRVAVKRNTLFARGLGAFTPASADPRLTALFARGGLDTSGFRFTPSDARRDGSRAVSVAVRVRTARGVAIVDRVSPIPASTVALTPIAYDMGAAVGWHRFALSGDVSKIDLAGAPGSRESADVGVSYTGRRFSGQVKAGADRPLPNGPRLIEEPPAYSIDVGGSYSLTRRLNVTAGVRYKAEQDRLTAQPSDSSRRDSQAVYIGTAFRF